MMESKDEQRHVREFMQFNLYILTAWPTLITFYPVSFTNKRSIPIYVWHFEKPIDVKSTIERAIITQIFVYILIQVQFANFCSIK